MLASCRLPALYTRLRDLHPADFVGPRVRTSERATLTKPVGLSTISQVPTTFRRGESAIQIHLTLAGIIAASLGYREKVVELPEGATVRVLLDSIDLP